VFWGVKSKKFPTVFKSAVKNERKIKEKQELSGKIGIQKIGFGFWCNSKTI